MTENKNQERILAAIEALLFVYGEPLEIKRIAKILWKRGITRNDTRNDAEIKETDIKIALEKLQQQYQNEDRGLRIIFSDNRVQLATKPKFALLLEDFVKEEFKENLTPASLETVSLIAYLGPLSRAQIDYYRGVNSSFILRSLSIRGLIERYPDPQRTNVYLYQASFDLLKYLGISRVEELPEYEKFKGLSQNF
jgi:segregation and condensation protein B